MNIAIVAPSSVPFVVGGAEKFWWGLARGLAKRPGVFVDLIKIPCREAHFGELVDSYNAFSQLNLSHFDVVISTKYPAWMVQHHQHIAYIQHKLRGLYDTYHFTGLPESISQPDSQLTPLLELIRHAPKNRESLAEVFKLLTRYRSKEDYFQRHFSFPGPLAREIIHFFDDVALSTDQIAAYAAISDNVKHRKDYFPVGAPVHTIHHPSDLNDFRSLDGKYIFTTSRLTNCKRLYLLIEAMRYVSVDIPFLIAGAGPEAENLKAMAQGDKRIQFLGFVSDEELLNLYAGALFVPFVPYDEDYGLITIEAMRSGKPVITATDSGGVCEFVQHGATGLCVSPTAQALGAAMQELACDPLRAAEMGQRAKEAVSHITWSETGDKLLATLHGNKSLRPKILVATTFPIFPAISGGQKRIANLYGEISKEFDVTIITLGAASKETVQISPSLREIRLPWSPEHAERDTRLHAATGASTGDISAMLTCSSNQLLLETIQSHGQEACILIASHPYLFPALTKACPGKYCVYDAHNVEYDMKRAVLGNSTLAQDLLLAVHDTESACFQDSDLVFCCAKHDATRFGELYGIGRKPVLEVPNGCDSDNLPCTSPEERLKLKEQLGASRQTLVLFMGSLHGPNIDAALHILKLAQQVPEAEFLVVGSVARAPQIVGIELPANVHFLGELLEQEKNILLKAADIAINPITSGAGTNLKVIEFIASCIPTVSTPFGLRGLPENIKSFVAQAELNDFAVKIRQEIARPREATTLNAARTQVLKTLSWTIIGERATRALKDLLAGATGAKQQ